MQVIQHDDPGEFAARVRNTLLASECENCALIGLVDSLAAGRLHPPADPLRLMLSLESSQSIEGVAVQTRPTALLITRIQPDGVEALTNKLMKLSWPGQGFTGPAESVDALAAQWCALTGRSRRLNRGLRVFKLTSVIAPRPAPGTMVAAPLEHVELLARWRGEFACEIGEPETDARRAVERIIAEKRLFLWNDGQFRAMTGIACPTPHGMRINQVYTPQGFRRRGYASNLVAAVSQHLLDSGRTFCFLFTDLANPTSNHIYQQIGYYPESDFRHWIFE